MYGSSRRVGAASRLEIGAAATEQPPMWKTGASHAGLTADQPELELSSALSCCNSRRWLCRSWQTLTFSYAVATLPGGCMACRGRSRGASHVAMISRSRRSTVLRSSDGARPSSRTVLDDSTQCSMRSPHSLRSPQTIRSGSSAERCSTGLRVGPGREATSTRMPKWRTWLDPKFVSTRTFATRLRFMMPSRAGQGRTCVKAMIEVQAAVWSSCAPAHRGACVATSAKYGQSRGGPASCGHAGTTATARPAVDLSSRGSVNVARSSVGAATPGDVHRCIAPDARPTLHALHVAVIGRHLHVRRVLRVTRRWSLPSGPRRRWGAKRRLF